MTQFYSDPSKEQDKWSLPNAEVFYLQSDGNDEDEGFFQKGYYYWYCLPGCLPDSEPIGPFETAQLAIKSCQECEDICGDSILPDTERQPMQLSLF
jgi:hypothetical protein